MSSSVKDNCAGKQIWRSNSETHSAESFESLNSDHIDLDSLGRLSLRKKDDAENRQGSCHTKWVFKHSIYFFSHFSSIRMPALTEVNLLTAGTGTRLKH